MEGKYKSAQTRIMLAKINVPARRTNIQPLSSERRQMSRAEGTLYKRHFHDKDRRFAAQQRSLEKESHERRHDQTDRIKSE